MTTKSSLPQEPTGTQDVVNFEDLAPELGITYTRAESPERETIFDELRQLPTYTLDDINRTPLFSRGTPGVGILDYDGDGDLDIFVTNGPETSNSLYSNQLEETGQLSFVDVAEASGVALTEQDSTGVSFGDIDNDGDHDLLVLGAGEPNRLLENQGDGTFIDITETSGLGGDNRYSSSASMGDVNGDGLLDIVIANSFDWNTLAPIWSEPFSASDEHNQLLLNQGNNQFVDVSATSGIENLAGLSDSAPESAASITWAIAMVDYDLDGDVDIIQADDQGAIPGEDESPDGVDRGLLHVFENDGRGNFTDVNVEVNLDKIGGWMGLSFGDFNADGNLDIFGSNFGDYASAFFGNPIPLGQRSSRWFLGQDNGTFSDPGVGELVATPFGWGTSTTDYDNDGDTDIVSYGGYEFGPYIDISTGTLLQNDGNANFSFDRETLVTAADHGRRSDKGVAVGDLNQDGFTDIVSASDFDFPEPLPLFPYSVAYDSPFDEAGLFGPTFEPIGNFFETEEFVWSGLEATDGTLAVEINSGDNSNGSVQVELIGTADLISDGSVNRDGIGSIVFFTPENSQTLIQPILGGSSFLSQDSLAANFGLGSAESGMVEVLWSGGVRNRLYDVEEFDRIVFPEIPVSFDGEFESQQEYEAQVSEAISELLEEKVLTETEAEKFFDSAVRAFVENQQQNTEDQPEIPEILESETAELEIVKDLFEALETGDRETFLELQTTNVNWEVSGNTAPVSPNTTTNTEIIPFAGSWFGREGISKSVGDFFDVTQKSIEISKFETLDLIQDGNQIIARVNVEATVKETGLPFDIDMAYIVEVEDSEDDSTEIESVRVLYNTFSVAEAFAGQTPSSEAIALDERNLLEGVPLSVNPDADSAETLEVVESAYPLIGEQNIEGFGEALAKDATFILDGDPSVLPTAQLVEGPEGVLQFFGTAFEFLEPRVFNIENTVADGDRAAVVFNLVNSARENDFPTRFDSVHFVTVEDGLIDNVQVITDTYSPTSALAGEPLFTEEQPEMTMVFAETEKLQPDTNEIFVTGNGEDFLGTDGDDTFLSVGGGENLLTGGAGADAFWIANGEFPTAANIITDLAIDEDVIGIGGLGAASINELDFSQVGDNSIIAFSGIDLGMLLNTNVNVLQTNGNFVFA
ncbi:FG-GAP-like repeat-containing protein [Pleurocapsa sp. PCC 7319]|uniref:FG-GAP-like repeat-containing protein n=1 Tax=Pleurocapsa sp. PCC 7319 TaxID=118161 RepID=UPI00034A287C|nr:FG-GAP-like repeat-containing protein [Pleurocapsa sp. PCC 7319]